MGFVVQSDMNEWVLIKLREVNPDNSYKRLTNFIIRSLMSKFKLKLVEATSVIDKMVSKDKTIRFYKDDFKVSWLAEHCDCEFCSEED